MRYHTTSKDDELCHWKYIKKVRGKNGKWRYYYNQMMDDLGADVKSDMEDTKKVIGASLANEKRALEKVKYAKDYMDSSKNKSNTIQSYAKYDYEKQLSNHKLHTIRTYIEKTRYNSLIAKYEKTPLGKLEKEINKGKKWISDLFD